MSLLDLPSPRPDREGGAASSSLRRPAPSMRLQALRRHDLIVDFVWTFASEQAAALLQTRPRILQGMRLGVFGAIGPPGQPDLIERYRCILEHAATPSFDHVHAVDGQLEVVIHRVAREGDGIAVTLTNLSADRRAQTLRLQGGAAA